MKPLYIKSKDSPRHRRLGRKVLQADRLSHALGDRKQSASRSAWLSFNLQPKWIAMACAAVVVVGVLGLAGSQLIRGQQAVAQKAAVAEEKSQSIAADACRRKKAEAKADLIGKVTYDELYDGNECDK